MFFFTSALLWIWSLFFPDNHNNLTTHSLEHDGLKRYFVEHYQPTSSTSNNPPPLVIVLHGGGGSMTKVFGRQRKGTQKWLDLSDTNGFLLLAPNGTKKRRLCLLRSCTDTKGNRQNWNDLRDDRDVNETGADDVGFIVALIDWAITNRSIDPDRVYITGASNGGMMTFRMLIEQPALFASGASFIGNLPQAQVDIPGSPTPIFLMNGTEDPLVKWEGGEVGRNRGVVRSSEDTRDFFVNANGADLDNPVLTELPDVDPDDGCRITSELYRGDDATTPAPVQFYSMVGGGHVVPTLEHSDSGFLGGFLGGFLDSFLGEGVIGPPCHDADGAVLAWEFMSQFSLQ